MWLIVATTGELEDAQWKAARNTQCNQHAARNESNTRVNEHRTRVELASQGVHNDDCCKNDLLDLF